MTTDQVELQVVRDVVRQELVRFFGENYKKLIWLIVGFMGCMAVYWTTITLLAFLVM